MLNWKFYINDIEVEEPLGWDAAEFTLQRSDKYIGLENIYSDNFLFEKLGGSMLKSIYETEGIDGAATLTIKSYCETTLQDTAVGPLNFIAYKEINGEVSIKFETSGFRRTVNNRFDTKIDLRSGKDVDGNTIGAIALRNIRAHSKEIIEVSRMEQNPDLLSVESSDNLFAPATPTPIEVYFPLMTISSELEAPIDLIDFIHINELANATSPLFALSSSGVAAPVIVEYKLKGTFYEAIADIRTYGFEIIIAHGADGSENQTGLFGPTFKSQNGGITSQAFDISGSIILNLSPGDKVFLYIVVSNYSTTNATPQPALFELISDAANYLKFTQATKENPSSIDGALIYEAFAQICHSISGVEDCFRSSFFGGLTSFPALDADGCGRYFMTTNGKAIRNMLDKNGDAFPIVMSFNDLFDACNAIWNLGMRIEVRDDKEYIVVEEKSYFYNTNSTLQFVNVANITRSPAIDLIYNEFECGYRKWNLNVGEVNGIYEINTKHNYALPIKNAKKKLSAISEFAASSYLIERTRRIQYLENATTDFETDDLNFIISLNKETVSSDLYQTTEVIQDYPPGTVTERDERFSSIENVISPETMYNLALTPAQIAMNWWNWISSSFARTADTSIMRFLSGEGNVLESHVLSDGSCNKAEGGTVAQNQNIEKADLLGKNGDFLYIPNYLELEYPFSYSEFLEMAKNSINSIDISCENGNFIKGFVKEVVFMPNQEGGMARFKLIEALCAEGGFDDGFDDGFDNTDCD